MIGDELSDEARRQWFADKEAKRDAVLEGAEDGSRSEDATETPSGRASLKAIIVMGPERTRAASSHPQYAQRYR